MDTGIPPSQGLSFYEQGMPSGLNDPFEAFLGPAPRPQMTNPYEKRNVSVFSMPENYLGRNLFLADTIMDFMFTATQTHLTERVMPWFNTDEIYVQWQQWETNAHLLDVTPHQSVSKRITQRRNIRRGSLVRRGLMYEFEHDFVKTALGQLSFVKGLGQIARSVQETANIEVIRALVNSHRFQQEYQRQNGVFRKGNLKQALEHDRNRFGLVQKDQLGLEKWDAEVRAEMYAWRGQANAILMGEEISIYATFVGPRRTDYDKAGARGPARVNNDPAFKQYAAGNTQGAVDRVEAEYLVRDSPVFLCRSYAVDGVGRQEQLTRVRAIGGHAVMHDECPSDVHYKSHVRDICIFDEDNDDFGRISIDMAIDNCSIWDTNGKVYAQLVNPENVYGVDMQDATSLEKRQLGMNFLARANPDQASNFKHLPIEYIGDIAHEFFSDESLLKAAQSVAHAVFRGDTSERNTVAQALNGLAAAAPVDPEALARYRAAETVANDALQRALDAVEEGEDPSPDQQNVIDAARENLGNIRATDPLRLVVADDAASVVTRFAQRLRQLMGDGFLFNATFDNSASIERALNGGGNIRVEIVPGGREYDPAADGPFDDRLVNRGRRGEGVAEENRERFPEGDKRFVPITSKINTATDTLLQTLIVPLAKLGDQYAQPAHRIAQDTSKSAEERAHAIREHINSVVDQQVPGFFFAARPAVTDWFNKRLDGYRTHISKLQSEHKQAPSVSAAAPVASSMRGTETRKHPLGAPLPQGWRYKNEYLHRNADRVASEIKRTSGYGFLNANMFNLPGFLDKKLEAQERAFKSQQQGGYGGSGGARYAGSSAAGRFETLGAINFGEAGAPGEGDIVRNIKERHEGTDGTVPERRFNNIKKRVGSIAQSAAPGLLQLCALAYLGARFTKTTLKSFRRLDIRIPVGFILARPQGTFRTRSIVKCQLDGGCGNTFFGHSEAKVGHDNARGLGLLHFTAYLGAIITNPKNVYVQHDAMIAEYLGGFNLRFWTPEQYRAFVRSNQRSPERSICCFIIPYEERNIPVVFDVAGRFYTEMASGLADQRQGSQLAFSTAPMYNQLFGFHGVLNNTAVSVDQAHNARRKHVGRIVWRECQYNFNLITGRFDKYRANQGHLGKAIYPSCAQVHNGSNAYLDPKQVLVAIGN